MAKNFDDFAGLTEDEIVEIQSSVSEILGLDSDENVTTVPLASLPTFLAALNQRMTMQTLRKYHEWLNS